LKSGNKVEKKPVEENKIDTDKNKSEKKKIEVNEKFVRENPLLLKQIADALESSEQVKKLTGFFSTLFPDFKLSPLDLVQLLSVFIPSFLSAMGNCSNFDSISFLLTTFAACFSHTASKSH
jgi:hypothetical protein